MGRDEGGKKRRRTLAVAAKDHGYACWVHMGLEYSAQLRNTLTSAF